MKAAAYMRVSTNRQNPENQEADMRALCRHLRWKNPRFFIEKASGVKDRSVWAEVLRRTTKGEFGAVVVWSIDRMGRNFYEITDAFRAFEDAGVSVASVQEPWVLDLIESPFRPALIAISASYAAFEHRRIRERIFAGLATAKRKGKKIGRPRTISGAALEMAVRLRKLNGTWTEIAAALEKAGHKHPITKKRFPRGTIAYAVNDFLASEEKKTAAGGAGNPPESATAKPAKSRKVKRA